MIEILILILVVTMISLYRKTANRVALLEREMEIMRQALARPDAVSVAALPEAQPNGEMASDITAPLPAEDDAPPSPSQPEEPSIVTDQDKPKGPENLESYLGARWPVWIGGVALAFGGVFLVRYSIENSLLGPQARLAVACIFGLILLAVGEILRRRAMPQLAARFSNAMIPGALTAAGTATLMGAIFATYAIYDFIGPATAFVLLASVSLATIGLSLLHGQALAGLGLLASLVTPALVSSGNGNAPALFGFLGLSWLSVNAASRLRGWTAVPLLANVGAGLWAIIYMVHAAPAIDPAPQALMLILMAAGTAFLWPGRTFDTGGAARPGVKGLLRRPPLKITLSLSIMTLLAALVMVLLQQETGDAITLYAAAAIVAAVATVGASRAYAVWPALAAAATSILAGLLTATLWAGPVPIGESTPPAIPAAIAPEATIFLLLGAVFTFLGFAVLWRFRKTEREFSIIWAFLMPVVPVTLAVVTFLNFGDLGRDWPHGAYGILLGLVLLVGAGRLFNSGEATNSSGDLTPNLLLIGSFAGFALALHALTNGIATTVLVSILGFAYVIAMRFKPWAALPWAMAAAILIVFGRIAWEPTLIGPNSLGTTPFLNALLPGYGIPTALAIATAWLLRNSSDFRIRNVMQALASLAVLMTITVLVRHAMNGGVLDARIPSLGEQSIYTLVTIGFSGILMTLDLKSPSPVFRFGSMIAGVIATLNVLSLHLFALNPYFSGESTGRWPFVNLLLIGYLLPALAYGLTAWLARGRRPMPYVAMLSLSGGLLGLLWATLSVRRFWHGEHIAEWKGFLQTETYAYSVVWLLIGVILLALGSKFDAKSLRLASAVLVLATVAKVFLIDMSNLEGILRALSFIGLGAVLIGIGLFYQRILGRRDG